MTDRQFRWGLANGVAVFAIAGAFWLGLGIGTVAPDAAWPVSALSTLVQVGVCVALLWAAARLRRRAGFRRAELRQGDDRATAETRRIMTGLRWTIAGQAVLIGLAVWACVHADAEQLIWPAIALAVSLHLVPLARIFHVRAYYVTAAAGSLLSFAALATWTRPYVVVWLACGMAIVMWMSAGYLLLNVDKVAARAAAEPWAV
jgi:hypothetical protein